jgi:hypothetical protein
MARKTREVQNKKYKKRKNNQVKEMERKGRIRKTN